MIEIHKGCGCIILGVICAFFTLILYVIFYPEPKPEIEWKYSSEPIVKDTINRSIKSLPKYNRDSLEDAVEDAIQNTEE